MGSGGSPTVRVWKEVLDVYRKATKKNGLRVSDLVSIVLLYAPIVSPASVVLGLQDKKGLKKGDALNIAYDLKDSLEKTVTAIVDEKKMKLTG
ncbi:MAG: hypothetical protein G5Z42_07810 [Caldisphaeraceae archaeon]|nr:hypothetical protein [Caldisphaeraceae archaeon]MEB3691332.1 hypothetical protein [Caldisphaeraceae archaeon]MEB3798698.1 hypothetical protein [Caldisphaeraceae archaeon]